jgi:CheY-like chemotaxis protein
MGNGELVLVVEDNDKVRQATVSGLESLGYNVLEAKTGPDAITLIESNEPIALVFSDIIMPGGMTGYDVAERVCSMKPNLNTARPRDRLPHVEVTRLALQHAGAGPGECPPPWLWPA